MSTFESLSFGTLVKGKNVLHFAPEPLLSPLLIAESNRYTTADYIRDDVDLQLDMCDLGVLEDNSFDLIIACDVLEHVPNDSVALQELYRILKSGGCAILTVPQKDGLIKTFEDTSIATEAGRLKAFGQEDHLRIYGDDFPEVLKLHKFAVTTIDQSSFNDEVVRINVLFPPVLSPHPLATNYRKVFFAQKLL